MSSALTHMVFFTLNQPEDEEQVQHFFSAAEKLGSIPGVQGFKCVKQFSQKNNYDYGLTMDFEDDKAYQGYLDHPEHVAFVEKVWKKTVRYFMEIDYRDL